MQKLYLLSVLKLYFWMSVCKLETTSAKFRTKHNGMRGLRAIEAAALLSFLDGRQGTLYAKRVLLFACLTFLK